MVCELYLSKTNKQYVKEQELRIKRFSYQVLQQGMRTLLMKLALGARLCTEQELSLSLSFGTT